MINSVVFNHFYKQYFLEIIDCFIERLILTVFQPVEGYFMPKC